MEDREYSTLVITRRAGEVVYIGDHTRVEIVRSGKQVRLAITAPRQMPIVRDDLKTIRGPADPGPDPGA